MSIREDSPLCSLSVVVVTVYSSTNLINCLTALEQQIEAPDDIEIIVVCHENIKDISGLMDRFSKVQFYRVPGLQSQDTLRAFGVRQARGKVVAITVEHCAPEKHWCASIMKAHKGPYAAIGGTIEKGTQPDTLVNWAVHLYDYCNYGYYLNPILSGPAHDLSDCNVSYKRESLAATADLWMKGLNVPLLNRALLARDEILWLTPDIVVRQNRDIDLSQAVRIAYLRGRAFASARLNNSSLNQRIFYAVFSPFMPLMLLRRLIVNMSRKKSHFSIALRAMPIIGLLAILWSSGEFLGYLLGQRGITLAVTEE